MNATQWRGFAVSMVLLAGVLSWQTLERNRQWQDLGRLWAIDLERGASLHRAALNSGVAFLRAGDTDRAMQMFDRIEQTGVATKDRQRGKIAQLKGEVHFRRGDPEAALAEFRRALEWIPEWTRSAYFAAMALIQLDRVGDAGKVLAQMQEHQPGSVFTISLEAEMLSTTQSTRDGIAHLRDYLSGASRVYAVNRSFLHLHLGNLYRDLGDWAAAARHYRLALEESGENWAARAGLAEVESRLAGEQ